MLLLYRSTDDKNQAYKQFNYSDVYIYILRNNWYIYRILSMFSVVWKIMIYNF